jgi:hypothetical protein
MQVVGLNACRERYFEDVVEWFGTRQIMPSPSMEIPMELILIIVVVVLLFGGGGYWGRSRGHW